ncbi:MAG: hypothetical protein Q9209_001673 [Squamulea sp. 1 TL-2023]
MNRQNKTSKDDELTEEQKKPCQRPIPVLLVNGEKVIQDYNDEMSENRGLPHQDDHPLELSMKRTATKTHSKIRSPPSITVPDSTRLHPYDSRQRSAYDFDPDTMSEDEVDRRVHGILIDFYSLLKSTENLEDVVKGIMEPMTLARRRLLLKKMASRSEEIRLRMKEARRRKHERATRDREVESERDVAMEYRGGGEPDPGVDNA